MKTVRPYKIRLTLSEYERQTIEQEAAKAQLSMAAYVRFKGLNQ